MMCLVISKNIYVVPRECQYGTAKGNFELINVCVMFV